MSKEKNMGQLFFHNKIYIWNFKILAFTVHNAQKSDKTNHTSKSDMPNNFLKV